MYKTSITLRRNLRIDYPAGKGKLILRTEEDWNRDIEPILVSDESTVSTFEIEADQPFLYCKPCLATDDGLRHWSIGTNKLVLMEEEDQRSLYPFFFGSEHGRFSNLIEFPSVILGRNHYLRVYVPLGYDENTLSTYSVAFMQDEQNLFFPDEAFR